MEELLKQVRRSTFSGREDLGSTKGRTTPSFEGERGPQKWLRTISRQMSGKEPTEEAEYAAAVAAAAYAITSLEPDESDQRKPDPGQPFSLPRIISRIVDRIASAVEPGDASERIADEHQAEAYDMIPEKTIHPVPSIRRNPTMPKKRLSFAEELQEEYGTPINYSEKAPSFDTEEWEDSKRMKPTNSFTRSSFNERTPSFGENQIPNTKLPKKTSSTHKQFPPSPVPPPPAVPPLNLQPRVPSKRAKRPTGRRTETDADDWEIQEMAKIKERYEKLNGTILDWEDKKKKKARRKLETTEVRFQFKKDSSCYRIRKAILTKICLQESQNELEKNRTKALRKYQIEMERIKQIADGARAQAKEKRRNEEFKVKDKANKYRETGEPPMPPLCRCF